MKMSISRSIVFAASFLAASFQLRAQSGGGFMGGPGVVREYLITQATNTASLSPDITPRSVLTAMQRVADWQLAHPVTLRPTGWICAAGDVGMMALAGISGDPKYRDAMLAKGETNGWTLPQYQGRKYHADDQCIGQVWSELYFLYRDNRMIAPMRDHFDWILANPSTVQSLEHRGPRAEEQWSWCDALFMAPPAWARLYRATGDTRYLDFAVTNWWRTTDYLYDKNEHLFYRDSTFFNKTGTNGAKVFWDRGNGWVFAGTVRLLQYLPMNHPDRPRFEQLFKDMAEKILSLQQPDGLWRSSLLDPDDFPMPEASGSALFTYGLAWGVNQGLLDRAKFEPAVRKAWPALVGCVDADGKLTHIQPAGTGPVKFDANSTQPYGGGVFLLAGSEVYRMAVLELPEIPVTQIKSRSNEVLPVGLLQVPITSAIESLAHLAGINYVLDPRIGYDQMDTNGMVKPEPTISAHWEKFTAVQALQAALNNAGLQAQQNGNSVYISASPSPKISLIGSSPVALRITNPTSFSRDSETVAVKIEGEFSYPTNAVIMDGLSARILDSQFYYAPAGYYGGRQGHWRELLFQVDLAPGETRTFYILDASALAAVPPPIVKTMARYVPERHDDFAWESDRIAHRLFGPALETWQAEPLTSSGVDVWIKRTRSLVTDQMYHTGVYYDTNAVAQDDYKVGKTRGDGGVGIWKDGKLYVSKNWRTWKVITSGPIRSEFELTYDAWDAGGRKISETKRISIDAGSNLSRVESTFSSDDKSPLEIGVGLGERPGENVIVPDGSPEVNSWQTSTAKGLVVQNQGEGWMAYWQPQDFTKGTTAVAIVLPKGSVQVFTNDLPDLPVEKFAAPTNTVEEGQPAIRNLLAVAPAEIGKPFVYYLGAGWDQSGDFPDAKSWDDYIRRFAERRDQPLQVTVGN